MLRKLNKIKEIYHFENGVKVMGPNNRMGKISVKLYGDCSKITGYSLAWSDESYHLVGDCSNLSGDCSGLGGDCSGLTGDVTHLTGICTGIVGDCTGLEGSFDHC